MRIEKMKTIGILGLLLSAASTPGWGQSLDIGYDSGKPGEAVTLATAKQGPSLIRFTTTGTPALPASDLTDTENGVAPHLAMGGAVSVDMDRTMVGKIWVRYK